MLITLGKYAILVEMGQQENSDRKITLNASPHYDREGWISIERHGDQSKIEENNYNDGIPHSSTNKESGIHSDHSDPSDHSDFFRVITSDRYTETVSKTKERHSLPECVLLTGKDTLDLHLNYRRREKPVRLYSNEYPTITFDTVSDIQELLLYILLWGAFIATDLLFQLAWPV